MKRFFFNSVGSQTGRDNMLALVNSVHLAVFPFLDWKLDFLLHCLYRKTQTIQDYVGDAVFRRKSCIWIKDTSQLHVQAPSSSQNKHPYHVFELKPHNRLHMSPAHSPWCKEGLYINEQQAASSCASSHLCVHVFPLGSICIKPPKCVHLRLEISIFSFFLCLIPSLFQTLSPDLTHFVLTLPTLKALGLNWAGSQHLQRLQTTLQLIHLYVEGILKDVWLLISKAVS